MLKKTLQPDNSPDPDAEIEVVATFPTVVEADLIREELQAAGIDSWVSNAMAAQTFLAVPETGITVEVLASDAQRALEVIAASKALTPVTDEEMNAAVDASLAEPNPEV